MTDKHIWLMVKLLLLAAVCYIAFLTHISGTANLSVTFNMEGQPEAIAEQLPVKAVEVTKHAAHPTH